MEVQEIRKFCLSLPGVTEALTNDKQWTVFNKQGNVFLLIWKNAPIPAITIKLAEERGSQLEEEYNIVSTTSYLKMSGWVDVDIDKSFPSAKIEEWIKESYDLMVSEEKASEGDKFRSLSKLVGVK